MEGIVAGTDGLISIAGRVVTLSVVVLGEAMEVTITQSSIETVLAQLLAIVESSLSQYIIETLYAMNLLVADFGIGQVGIRNTDGRMENLLTLFVEVQTEVLGQTPTLPQVQLEVERTHETVERVLSLDVVDNGSGIGCTQSIDILPCLRGAVGLIDATQRGEWRLDQCRVEGIEIGNGTLVGEVLGAIDEVHVGKQTEALGELDVAIDASIETLEIRAFDQSFLILEADRDTIDCYVVAARHVEGKVIMYADSITESMEKAITETNRRREIQHEYNEKNHITPHSVEKEISQGLRAIIPEKLKEDKLDIRKIPKDELPSLVKDLTTKMKLAAANLEFEKAAALRDEIARINDFIEGKSLKKKI